MALGTDAGEVSVESKVIAIETPRRARTDDQKLARRQLLLDVAWEQFQTQPIGEITMAGIADRAGLAKGTVYLYFQTKEELFLAVEEQQLAGWFTDLEARLQWTRRRLRTTDAAELIADSLAGRDGLTRLLAIQHSLLEQNIDIETAAAFRQAVLTGLEQTGAVLERKLEYLAAGRGAHVLLRILAAVIGLEQLAHPAPAVAAAIAQTPELAPFRLNFANETAAVIAALLRAERRESEKKKRR